MLVKFKNMIINTLEIKYVKFEENGCAKKNKNIPFVTVAFVDGEILDIDLNSSQDIEQYYKFEKTILKSRLI